MKENLKKMLIMFLCVFFIITELPFISMAKEYSVSDDSIANDIQIDTSNNY